MTARKTFQELETEIRPDLRFMRRINNAHTWDTSTDTVRRIYDHLTAVREEFVSE
ncbi:hypothetical protein [Catellatospora sichuanensis]|uniref:hypothetical protein n=1 Tax=Catellatospora sichuanensis TaxID=1969805 RepID=UPI0016424FED|nr:hypothetical protein [Catellatospora sichuanensis]